MSTRSLRQLIELFEKKTVVVLEERQEALSAASRATVFRYLAQVGYRRSYNRNGRYYMRHDPSRYDKHGVFSYEGIHFSRHGNLSTTVSVFICESDTGCTQRELQELLRVRVQSVLLSMMRTGKVTREKTAGHFLYLHPDAKPRTAQIEKRRKMLAEHFFGAEKQHLCRRLGRASLGRDLEDQPAQAALAANLRHPDYVRILSGALQNRHAAFAALDEQALKESFPLVRSNRDSELQPRPLPPRTVGYFRCSTTQ